MEKTRAFGTCCSLKGVDGGVDVRCGTAVLPRSNLCVQSADVEQHTSLLEGQSTLRRRHARQRVVPERSMDTFTLI